MTEAQTPVRVAEPRLRQTGIGINYLGFTGSMGLAALGDASWYIALTWTLARNVSPAVEGSLLALASLPRMVALLGGGLLAARRGPRRVMVVSDLLRCLVMLAAAGMITLTSPSVPLLFVAAVLVALLSAFFIPASGAVKPLLLDDQDQVRGNALYILGLRGGQAVGGPLGAWLMGVGGVALVALVDAVGYACSAAASWRVRYRRQPPSVAVTERPRFGAQLAQGLCYLRFERGVLLAVLLIALTEVACAAPVNLGLVLLSHRLHSGAGGAGLLLTAYTLGAVASSGLALALPPLRRGGPALIIDTAVAGGCLLGAGLLHSLGPVLALYAVLGLVTGQSGVILVSLTQRLTPGAFRARVMTVLSLVVYASAPLANLLFGLLAAALGLPGTMAVFGCLAFAATVIVAVTPRLRATRLG
ncbi:MFS transporter [Streptacidiphilus sp. P02-A3a]|uniref:MFS transporter n=1 Tax=Streptacidiphilus sp. P02-A3a TaxID=2704468 RepID=UPI0015FD7739|nr:MFS transporter [Streptacidiphilus sp. P02-A3a]QMU67974.1 MFS transporter [Streptacidiphilus sp. P02-A3a]